MNKKKKNILKTKINNILKDYNMNIIDMLKLKKLSNLVTDFK